MNVFDEEHIRWFSKYGEDGLRTLVKTIDPQPLPNISPFVVDVLEYLQNI